MHPLAPDLTQLTDDDLHKKRGELQTRLLASYRIGNYQLIQQLQLLLEDYMLEIQRRDQKILQDLMNSQAKKPTDTLDITK